MHGSNDVGGIVGANDGNSTVTNCYNTAEVHGSSPVGGIVGVNLENSTVTNCYNTGEVHGDSGVGGVAGMNDDSATVTNCYYLTRTAEYGIGIGNGIGDGIAKPVSKLEIALTWSGLYNALRINNSVVVLGADVTYGTGGGTNESADLEVPSDKTVSLDLTGHVIDRGLENEAAEDFGSVIKVKGNLTITDSNEGKTGKITGGNTSGLGGGINIESGIFTLEGGTISGNRASVNGGGVFCDGTFKLSGGATISGNHRGTDTNDNVYLNSDKTITVTGALTNTTPIGVTMYGGTGTITSGLGTIVSGNTPRGTAANFTSDNAAYVVALNANKEAYLVPRESTPTATFAATGADSGELSGLNAGASYSISGAGLTTATVITADANGKCTTSGMTEGTLSIVKKGDGPTTADSVAQTITVTKAETPNLAVTQPTSGGTGSVATDSTHEYSTDGTSWTSCTGQLTGLTPGIYYVRVKANGTTLASDNQELTIAVSYKTVTSIGKIGNGDVYMAIDMPPGVPAIVVSGITEDFAESLLTNEEKTAVLKGAKLTVTLDMKDNGDTLSDVDKLKLGNKAKEFGGSNALIGLFLDISLFKQIGTNSASPVYDTNGKKVSMVLTVPEALRNNSSRITRTFFILRMHGDNIDKVGEGTGNGIPFDSDLFSTYALAYSDKQNSSGGGGTTPTYYTVRFEMNGHGTAVASRKVIAGQKVPKPEDPEEEGYTFGGWYSDAGLTSEYDFSSPVRKSMTLYARWEEIRYTVSFDLDGKGSIETQWVRKNGIAGKPDDPSAEGFTFGGWYLDSDCKTPYDFSTPVTKDITLYAKWVKDVLIYRLYNPNSGGHLFTNDPAEKDNLVLIGWEYEGVAWTAPESSNTPVYRVYNPNSGEHHYTMNAAEKDILVALGWNDEGICWYSDENQGTPLYRLYNPNATGQYAAGAHHYTKDVEERDYLIAAGWNDEGIGWYGK